MQSLIPIQLKIDKVFKLWLEQKSDEDFFNKLKENGYEYVLISECFDKETLADSIVFTPEDDPLDNSYYTPDGDNLQPIFMEKIHSTDYLEEDDDVRFWNIKTLKEYCKDFTDCIFSIKLK